MIVIIVCILVLLGALYWEYLDIKKVYARRTVYDITDPVEKEKEYKFYSTFMHDNNIMWRSFYISAVIATLLLYFYLKNYSKGTLETDCVAILLIMFLVFYLVHTYRSFHFYRVLASKVRSDYYVMDNIGGEKPKKRRFSRQKKV